MLHHVSQTTDEPFFSLVASATASRSTRPHTLCLLFQVGLASLLGVPLSNVALIITSTPSILGARPSRLEQKWQALRGLASRHVPWAWQVSECPYGCWVRWVMGVGERL
jgi:hypothetical protein